jgi:hypothetical protein
MLKIHQEVTPPKEYAGLKGNKELEEITTDPSTHSPLPGSSIPTKNAVVEIMGNAPSMEKIRYLSIRTEMGST